jgi:hypothetical protein
MVDDPQTTESAWSPSQSQRREEILAGDVLGMAGPGKKIAGLMACTVIRPATWLTTSSTGRSIPNGKGSGPRWSTPSPSNEKLWAKYAELRADSLRNDGDGARPPSSTAGQSRGDGRRRGHRLAAALSRTTMNQCDPARDESAGSAMSGPSSRSIRTSRSSRTIGEEMLTAEQIAAKTQRLPARRDSHRLQSPDDVHRRAAEGALLDAVRVGGDFTGYVVDYGTWPDQQRAYFTLRDVREDARRAAPGAGLEGSIYAGLDKLTAD